MIMVITIASGIITITGGIIIIIIIIIIITIIIIIIVVITNVFVIIICIIFQTGTTLDFGSVFDDWRNFCIKASTVRTL